MALENMDLNLLKVLDALLTEQNVTRAGRRVGLGQPATSSALKRLRQAFGDELLVMVGRTMQLTPRGEELKPQVGDLLKRIEATVRPRAFDPATAVRNFTVASADYATLIAVPAVLNRMERETPRMRLHVVDLSDTTQDELARGHIDAAIAPRLAFDHQGLRARSLFQERLVCIARRGHPEVDGKIDLATFKRLRQVRYQPQQDISVSAEAGQLKRRRIRTDPRITCPSFSALPFLVGASDAVALVQERLAQLFAEAAGIQIMPPPFRDDPIDVSLFWTPRLDGEPEHRWLRDAFAGAGQAL